MNALLLNGGRAIGLLGVVLMAVAVGARVAGRFTLGGYSAGTLMLAGIGGISVGCFLLLWFLAERARR